MAQLDGLTGRGGVSTCSLLRSSLAVPQALPQEGLSPQELPVLCPRAAERSFPSGLARHGCISSILYYLYSVSHLSLMCFLSCLSFSLTEMMRYLTKIQLGERCFLAQLLPIHRILFQPFISTKFCSLPKDLPQPEGTEWSSSTSPTLCWGTTCCTQGAEGKDRHCSSCLSLLLDPGTVQPQETEVC